MKKLLSSRLTFLYKIVFPILWAIMNMGLMTFIFIKTKEPVTFLIILMSLPILATIRLWKVSYDDKYLYLYNWQTTKTFELKDVSSINEGYILSLDPFFEIEIRDKKGTALKFDFMPRFSEQLAFMFSKKSSGHLLEIRNKIMSAKDS